MKHFVEFNVKNRNALCELYNLVHKSLFFQKKTGVFFPDYFYNEVTGKGTMGLKMRVLSDTKTTLEEIIEKTKALKTVANEGVQRIPDEIQFYVNVRRIQKKNQADKRRLAKRALQAGRVASEEEAIEKMKFMETFNNLPYLVMKSSSSGNLYPIHIQIRPSLKPIDGTFDSFGLSPAGTIPFF